ncbi:unnamed protein product [Linum tenue]|uniref:Secreted protein n=1 Tax=Linum tenue TaxID=586396 RepID=A0AAV0GZQ8_9ROSI|nr:unnamed protein product [Linum tenue]
MGYYVNNNFLVPLRVLLIVTTAALLLASPWAAATSSNSATIRPSAAVYVRGGDHGCGGFFSRKLRSGRFNEPDRGGFNEPNPAKGG